jgi:OOP family OmpA-OmpF porin
MDQSGSMAYAKAQAGHQKFDNALAAVNRLDKALPELGYDGGVALFAPYKPLTSPAPFKMGSLDSAVAGVVPPFNSFTPMGDGLASVGTAIGNLSGTTALILFTDGVANKGTDPIAEARTLYSKYAPNLCIHVISYADTPEGKQTIEKLGALSSCSVVTTDADMDKFAKNVLYDASHVTHPEIVEEVVVIETPKAEIVIVEEVITFNLLFGFDKSAITDEMIPVLEQAKMILEEDRGVDFVVSGHTDSTGPETYNQGLSERRATSVNDWLVSNGISSSRLKVVGYGETRSKYDNGTKEGRKLNRRVELMSR